MSRQKPGLNPALIVVIIVSITLIVSLVKNALGLYQSRNRLESTKQETSGLESTRDIIKQQIMLQGDPADLDQTIRNKLNLTLPEDTVVTFIGSPSANDSSLDLPPSPAVPPILQWWRLINP